MWSRGIDLSNWQGIVGWPVLNTHTEVDFAYFLHSDGEFRGRPAGAPLSVAEAFNYNIKHCQKPCGAYQYVRPHNTDPEICATNLVNDAGGMNLPPVCDLEEYDSLTYRSMSNDDIVEWCHDWFNTIYKLTNQIGILYNGAYFRGRGIISKFQNHPWWLPSYTAGTKIDPDPFTIKSPDLNSNQRTPDIWQYTDKGRILGITGNVDKNLMLTNTLWNLMELGDDMPSLAEITDMVKKVAGSTIYHVNPQTSQRVQEFIAQGMLEPFPESVTDAAFQVFPNFTMVYRTPSEVAELSYIGVPNDPEQRGDNWFSKLRLGSRDVAY